MRILHTSDWHLGRSFHGASLLAEQAEVVDRVVTLAEEERVDLVVIAGDLFDRAVPPGPAVELFDQALARLHGTGARVAAISGNHDSAVRVGGRDELLNRIGVAVRGEVARLHEPLLIGDPADGGPPVAVYLVPYLDPAACAGLLLEPAGSVAPARDRTDVDGPPQPSLFDAVPATEAGAGASGGDGIASAGDARSGPGSRRGRATHDAVTRAATGRVREHLRTLGAVRSVVVAHAFVAGGAVSDSERDLSVGGAERVALDAFDGFDLVALGHLHAPQAFADGRVAYSGSPLPYSFSEEGHVKSVRLVDLAPDGSVEARTVPLGVGRPLRTLTGALQQLLADPGLADAVDARVRVRLTDRHLPDQAMAKIRSRFPHAVELRHLPDGVEVAVGGAIVEAGAIGGLTPLDLALRFWADQQGSEATGPERELLAGALAAAQAEVPS